MKYYFDFQYMPKGHSRPLDDGGIVNGQADADSFALIPNVGDYVNIAAALDQPSFEPIMGRVRSRLFTYMPPDACSINIVVEETDDDVWPSLIKE